MATPPFRCLLIRHGQTPANVAGLLDTGAPGPGLTDLGRRQAEALPGLLAGEDIRRVVTSTLVRTTLTAAPLVRERGLASEVVAGLEEISAGSLEMSGEDDDHLAYVRTGFAWAAGDLDRAMPGGPDGHAFFDRYDGALAGLEAAGPAGGTVVVVSHGAAIRVWLAGRAVNVDVATVADRPLVNTGRVLVERGPHGWELVSWDDAVEASTDPNADPTGAGLDDLEADVAP